MRDMFGLGMGSTGMIHSRRKWRVGPDHSQHLGRAKEVSEYVKHGCQEAVIEIELAKDGKQFKKNINIRCTIKHEGNKSIYTVNGRPQSKKAVIELCKSLSIQIDNLCQFLPQDKVVEFAAMTPAQLLRETQRAVASQEMIDIHEELKDLRRKQKDAQNKFDADQDSLTNLENRQRLQEADVERMREREQVVDHVRKLEVARPFAQYRSARIVAREAKDKQKEAQNELKNLQNEVEPAMRAANEKEHYKKQIEKVVAERKENVTKAERHVDAIDRKFQDKHDKNNELNLEYNTERDSGRKYRVEITRVEQSIGNLKRQMEEAPSELDVQDFNERIRVKRRAVQNCRDQIVELKKKQSEATQRGRERSMDIQRANDELERLESDAGKQNSKLQRASHETAKLWDWVQQHPEEFEKAIYGPPIVECSIKEPKYVDLIESLFQANQMLAISAQTKKDFATLSDAQANLRCSEAALKTVLNGLDHFPLPTDNEAMRRYGFDGWVLEHVNGPDVVLAMLCTEMSLHRTGIALRDTSTEQFEELQKSDVSAWVTGKSSYRITRRREYGPGATSTQVRNLKKATFWTDQPIDLTAKRELQEKIEGWTEEIKAIDAENRETQTKIQAYREAIEKAAQEEARPLFLFRPLALVADCQLERIV